MYINICKKDLNCWYFSVRDSIDLDSFPVGLNELNVLLTLHTFETKYLNDVYKKGFILITILVYSLSWLGRHGSWRYWWLITLHQESGIRENNVVINMIIYT